jgi:hypothetical protein
MIAAGVNAKALSAFMGHSSIRLTFDPYGHLMPGTEAQAAALLDALDASGSLGGGRYILHMTAKEKLIRDVLDLDEAKAVRARIVVADEPTDQLAMAPLPEGWGETLTGEPMPNVAAALRRSRESH